jgi:hypothetical protein
LNARYTLLPYLNTLFYHAHIYGGTVMRGLQWNFPSDVNTLEISNQFQWGNGLMVAPVLKAHTYTRTIYFPARARWYEWCFSPLADGEFHEVTETGNVTVDNITLTDLPLYIQGGSILALQPSNYSLTINELRKKPFKLLVALGHDYTATGELFLDNGIDLQIGVNAIHASYKANEHSIVCSVMQNTLKEEQPPITSITVIGLPTDIDIDHVTVHIHDESHRDRVSTLHIATHYQSAGGQLDIKNIYIPINTPFTIKYLRSVRNRNSTNESISSTRSSSAAEQTAISSLPVTPNLYGMEMKSGSF